MGANKWRFENEWPLARTNFPRFDRNLNTGNNFASDTLIVKAEQRIYHNEKYQSCVVLPVIEK